MSGIDTMVPWNSLTDRPCQRQLAGDNDVALAGQQVGIGLHQGGRVAAIPQGAGALVAADNLLHIAPAARDDELRHRFRLL